MALTNTLRIVLEHRNIIKDIVKYSSPSFSQYGEDAILLKLLHPGKTGTYEDVGANHPIVGSNTFRLYLRGWSGLAIDPNPRFAQEFKRSRPRDTYLTEGVASAPATLTYYAFERHVFNTFDQDIAERLIGQGQTLLSKTPVRCSPLAGILETHLPDQQIDLLNIDCEGFDLDVLDSMNIGKNRPTIIIVEDFPRYLSFQQGRGPSRLETFIRDHRFLPLAQTAWSGIYIAEDWERLFSLSSAFDKERVQNGYLPGQVPPSDLED